MTDSTVVPDAGQIMISLAASTPVVESADPLGGLFILAGVLLAVFVLLRLLRKRVQRRHDAESDDTPRERLDTIRASATKRDTIDAIPGM